MTASLLISEQIPESWDEVDDAKIHALAWAMVEGVLDNQTARLTLLHAAAMLKALMALEQADPITAATELLDEHAQATLDFARTALVLRGPAPAGPKCPKCGGKCDPDWGCDKNL